MNEDYLTDILTVITVKGSCTFSEILKITHLPVKDVILTLATLLSSQSIVRSSDGKYSIPQDNSLPPGMKAVGVFVHNNEHSTLIELNEHLLVISDEGTANEDSYVFNLIELKKTEHSITICPVVNGDPVMPFLPGSFSDTTQQAIKVFHQFYLERTTRPSLYNTPYSEN